MKNQLISMEITSVGWTMFLIWVATLPLLTVLVSLLGTQNLNWTNEIGSLYVTLLPTNTLLLWSIALLLINLLCLYSFVLSITVTERGVITKLVEDTQTKNFGFIVHENLEHNTNQTDKPQT